jgi:hypothetical protein
MNLVWNRVVVSYFMPAFLCDLCAVLALFAVKALILRQP